PIINQIQGSTQINQVNLMPEVCLYNDTPLDQSKNFYPFGEEPKLNDTFYIALDDTFVKPNANITLTFELSRTPNLESSDVTITWEIEAQGQWQKIATTNSENQLWMNSSPQLIKNSPMTTTFNNQLTLETLVTNPQAKAKGTKIFLRYVISETVPPNYDPPIIQSLKLTYKFDFNEEAIYFAYNDFHYSQPKKFDIKLTDQIDQGSQRISLNQVEGLAVGEFLTFSSQPNPEIHQIQYINPQTNQLILVASLSQTYSENTPISCHFRPFIPTIDKNPSLYLGFDKPFSNQTVTLYAQVNPPSPEELSQAISRSNPQLIWEYFSPLGWQTLGVNDQKTGKISFGDGQSGMIPPRGRNNIRLSFYRVGGGEQGNLVSQSVNQLKTTIPYIDRVVNLEAAAGGANQEKLERLKERVPQKLRHRNRAVTLQDIEDLAYEASTDVKRVKLIIPHRWKWRRLAIWTLSPKI
ncbi:MAG: baseplate J/gp47 family protein, partial [Dolichospermum sp.]